MVEFPGPWKVVSGPLRPPPYNVKVIEIRAADGEVVIPWGGFDQMKVSDAKKMKLARLIVRAVNKDQRP